jgi:hypothetical protein
VDVRRGEQFLCVEEDVVIYDLNAGNITRVNKVGQFDMEASVSTSAGFVDRWFAPADRSIRPSMTQSPSSFKASEEAFQRDL